MTATIKITPVRKSIRVKADQAHARVLDRQLAGRRFVVGDALTLADFSLGATMNLADAASFPTAPYGKITRWYASLRALPAWDAGSAARRRQPRPDQDQYRAFPGVLGNGIASRTLESPVT
jgi:glutathione S-transferase